MLAEGGLGGGRLDSSVAGDGSRKHLGRGRRVRSDTNTVILYDIVIHILLISKTRTGNLFSIFYIF